MKTKISGLLLVTLLLGGCWQKSVRPFYTASDLVAEPKLAGTWREVTSDPTDAFTWSFSRGTDNRFELLASDKKERHEYEAHVFKLGERRYIDLLSKTRAVSTVPAHHLFQIVELGPDLKVKALNPSWMDQWLRKHPGSLEHIVVIDPEHRDNRDKDEFILTTDTKALQSFIRDHLKDEDFFTGEIVLKRESGAGAANETK
jgi:hypothetical protein